MYRPKLMGKPLVLDVTALLKRIEDTLQGIFRTYPLNASGLASTKRHGLGAGVEDVERIKREARLRAGSWKGKSTAAMSRNWIR